MKPLNGEKTHPLSERAISALRSIEKRSTPRLGLNPGIANRLLREALVESVRLPSPYKTHGGKLIEHLAITSAGRAALR